MYKSAKFRFTGVAPLLMHNGQLADPLNKFAQELKRFTSVRKKADDTHEKMARAEFMGGLYIDEKGRPAIPGECIEAMVVAAAKESKQGKDAKKAIVCDGIYPLEYDGPKAAEALVGDERFHDRRRVKVGTSCVMRTRPIFNEWSLEVEIQYLPEVMNRSTLNEIIRAAELVGIGDYRPRYGRFTSEVLA